MLESIDDIKTPEYMAGFRDGYEHYKRKHQLNSRQEPTKCDCEGWGCRKCCDSDAEIRSRQGTYG